MVSEDGSIKSANISVAPALDLYRKKLKIVALSALLIGAVGLIIYIALSSVIETKNGESPLWVDAFLIFAVPFALGLIGYVTIVRLGKRENKENRTSECVFYADCFFYSFKTPFQPETVTEKYFYSDCVLKRENEKYGYIFIISKGLLVFGKEGLEERELNAIRKQFKLAVPDDDIAELKNYKINEGNK